MQSLSKSLLRATLKEAGLVHPTIKCKTRHRKSKEWGILGGTIGPLTVTDAHLQRNAQVTVNAVLKLRSAGFTVEKDESNNLTITFGKEVMRMVWDTVPCYGSDTGYDSAYRNYYLKIV